MSLNYEQLYNKYNIKEVEKIINCEFDDKNLIVKAFIHPSFNYENNENYQRLEFLGDAVLQIVMSDYMYRFMPEENEGIMSKTRARLVNEYSLSQIIKLLELERYIIIGRSIANDCAVLPDSFMADVFEAIVAAIYLDQGYLKAEEFLKKNLINNIDKLLSEEATKDYKTQLQEILQANGAINIEYKTNKNDENNEFVSLLYLEALKIGTGKGKTKKIAEQQAAKNAIENRIS